MKDTFKYLHDKRKQHEHVQYKDLQEYIWDFDINVVNFTDIITDDINSPAVIRGFYRETPAFSQWNIDNIGSYFGQTLFDVECYDTIDKYYIGDKNEKKKYKTTLSNYAKYLKNNNKVPFYYLAEVDIQEKINNKELPIQMPMLIFNPNMQLLADAIHSQLIFFGNTANSNCHIHIEENYFLNQVFGTKTVYLFEFDDSNHMITKNCESLYKNLGIESCNSINFINENFFDLDHSKFNNLYKVFLNPGDTLVIPPHWWHATQGHGINCSITSVVPRKDISYFYTPRIRYGLIFAHFLNNELTDTDNPLEFFDKLIQRNYTPLLLILSSFYIYFSKTKCK